MERAITPSGQALSPAALTYKGNLPGEYIIHVTSPTHYGQLQYLDGNGTLASFDVDPTSTLENRTYANVLTGISSVTGDKTGRVGSYQWSLEGDAAGWDLIVTLLGPDAANTLRALGYSRDQVLAALRNRASLTVNALSYDCNSFGPNGLCFSFNARYSSLSQQDEGAGILTAAYRVSPKVRVGVFVDYAFSRKNQIPGIVYDGNQPMFGGFIGYAQKDNGLGLQARIAGVYHSEDVTLARSGALENTEAGLGASRLKAWAIGGEVGYGVKLAQDVRLTPYVGLRYGYAGRRGYTEATTSDVEYPVTYAAYSQRLTTGATGLVLNGNLNSQIDYKLGGGIEYDLKSTGQDFAGSSNVPDMATFALSDTASDNKFRGQGSAELGYAITPKARMTLGVSVRGEGYTDKINANVTAGLQLGF